MPLQEFLASYAVQVDEDGARRLQAILDKNRDSGQQLATVFESAYTALTLLKKELSDANGLKNLFSDLNDFTIPKISTAALPDLSGGLNRAGASLSGGSSVLSVSADMTSAEKSLTSFRSRLEAEKPKLSANPTGITSAVSAAIASIRAMMSSVRLTIPVTAVAHLDISSLPVGGTTRTSPYTRTTANSRAGYTVTPFGEGGRVSRPTLAMIAEEGEPEYVIPTDNDARAVPLLRSLLSELSESAKSKLFSLPESAKSKLFSLPESAKSKLFTLPDGSAGNLMAAKPQPEAETARDAESVSKIGKITLPADLLAQQDLSSVLRKMAEPLPA